MAVADPGFARGGTNPRGGANILFGIIFAKNCTKMKNIGLKGGAHSSPPQILHCVVTQYKLL